MIRRQVFTIEHPNYRRRRNFIRNLDKAGFPHCIIAGLTGLTRSQIIAVINSDEKQLLDRFCFRVVAESLGLDYKGLVEEASREIGRTL